MPPEVPKEAGWIAVCASDEIAIGGVRAARGLARDMVVWRGEDGRVRALPARCPHVGVDMATGGRVHGNWIECPFHKWRWDEAGGLRDVPYSVKPIPAATGECTPKFPVREVDGQVWLLPS